MDQVPESAQATTAEPPEPEDVLRHLARYGIRHFSHRDDHAAWAMSRLSRKQDATIGRLRAPFRDGVGSPEQYRRFYDFAADHVVASVVYSEQADDLAQMMLAITPHLRDKRRILDVGCNIGIVSTWAALLDPSSSVRGVDFSPKCIEQAKQKAVRIGTANVHFQCADLRTAVFSETYDAVLDGATLQYVSNDDGVIARILGALEPTGVVISVPQLGSFSSIGEHLSVLQRNGLRITSFGFVYSSDRGKTVGRPLIIASRTGHMVDLDLRRELDRARQVVARGVKPVARRMTAT